MKKLIMFLVITAVFLYPTSAKAVDRYDTQGQVIFENYPEKANVMQVYLRSGFATKLEFEESVDLTVNGNNRMLSLIESKDRKSLILYPKQISGVTNLLVDTKKRKMNYEVVIGNEEVLDYRISGNESTRKDILSQENIPLGHLVRLANNYKTIKELGILTDEEFMHKSFNTTYNNKAVVIYLRRVLSYRSPHYLFFDIEIINGSGEMIEIDKKNTIVLVNGKEFKPEFTALYDSTLLSNERTNGWIVLEHTQLSMENNFKFSMEINNENRLFD